MKRPDKYWPRAAAILWTALLMAAPGAPVQRVHPRTIVEIKGEKFIINGRPTYADRHWQGLSIEGLLFNSRMVQGVFDDSNPATREAWKYPDTGTWDPDRNTNEFVGAMAEWKTWGVIAFTLNLQGGSPVGYGNNRGWVNSAFDPDGNPRPEYFARLERILDRADELGMVVILGLFYFGQDQHLKSEAAVLQAVDQTMDWLFRKAHRNILIEIDNECDVESYDHAILKPDRVHELILRVKRRERNGYHFSAGTSYGGGTIPGPKVVQASDFLLLHGNGVSDPNRIGAMVRETRRVQGYRPMPILFNEDDHYDFEKPLNNLVAAVRESASWGFFDYRRTRESFEEGFQSVPVDWGIHSDRKRSFFQKIREITGGN